VARTPLVCHRLEAVPGRRAHRLKELLELGLEAADVTAKTASPSALPQPVTPGVTDVEALRWQTRLSSEAALGRTF